ncbi:MAG: LemA family protein [Alphaproteobacteria bacterium]|nr:LemA family protein [Alphaproteobacteria bacterium]
MSSFDYFLIGLLAVVLFFIVVYNRLVALGQACRKAFADIDVQLKQRYDLIPNLVEAVKGYAGHESEIFTKVTEARASAMQAKTVVERGPAETALSGALMQLLAVSENYPDLKANENFKQLQGELGDLENKIAAARRFFNNAVTEYNTAIEQIPGIIVAKLLSYEPFGLFDLADKRATVEEAPKVSFDK